MCGITGFIDFKNKSNTNILEQMLQTINHRGPDDYGTFFLQKERYQLGLGHKRLSIIDLSEGGSQPKHFNKLSIVFNGEIYNYKEINSELEGFGYVFQSHSDTETILKAYDKWGEKCLDRFIGMFAFVIYDAEKEILFSARDRAGVKPLYFYSDSETLLFASELKAFHKHPAFKKEINMNAVAAYLQYGHVPQELCIFNNCSKLNAGTYTILDLKNQQLQTAKYWGISRFYAKEKLNLSYDEAKEQTKELLHSSFQYRMVSDVPIGVFLSGGYDSTCLSAMLQEKSTEKLNTYTIAVPDIGLNEAPFAKKTADYIGTNHTEIACTEKEAMDLIQLLPFHFDEPFADPSAIPTMLVSLQAKKNVTVALSADGGDEIFAGYARYDDFFNFLKREKKITSKLLEKLIKTNAAGFLYPLLDKKIPNFKNRIEKLKEYYAKNDNLAAFMLFHKQYSNRQINDFILKKHHQKIDLSNIYTGSFEHDSLLSNALNHDFNHYMQDDILVKVDRASMFASLEAREPFLDHRLIEFICQLPDNFKYHNGNKKIILKDIVHDYLPKEMMERPKMGFAIPLSKWLLTDLKPYVDTYFDEKYIVKQELFCYSKIEELQTNFYLYRKEEFGTRIWNVLMFQMWYDEWMVNKK